MPTRILRRRLEQPHVVFGRIIREHITRTGIGMAGIAGELASRLRLDDRSASWLYKYIEGERNIPVDVWLALHEMTDDQRMPEWMAASHDCLFVPFPKTASNSNGECDLIDMIASFLEAAKSVADCLGNPAITEDEYSYCEEAITKAVDTAMSMKQALLSRAIKKLKNEINSAARGHGK